MFSHLGEVPRTPASNEKLLLSMALLARFGSPYRIATTVEGPRVRGGAVRGNLWLVGHGDPELGETDLARLARKLRATGERRVRGSVIGVTTTFTRERWAPGWQPIALHFIGLPTALAFEGNVDRSGFVFDPERRAAAELTTALRAQGIRVHGPPRVGPGPRRASVIAATRSAPLVDILRRQNVASSNLDAETLDKMLGADAYGSPGSIAKGAAAIEAWARREGVHVVA